MTICTFILIASGNLWGVTAVRALVEKDRLMDCVPDTECIRDLYKYSGVCYKTDTTEYEYLGNNDLFAILVHNQATWILVNAIKLAVAILSAILLVGMVFGQQVWMYSATPLPAVRDCDPIGCFTRSGVGRVCLLVQMLGAFAWLSEVIYTAAIDTDVCVAAGVENQPYTVLSEVDGLSETVQSLAGVAAFVIVLTKAVMMDRLSFVNLRDIEVISPG